jgi:SAM-dependent methyltransferase
LNSDDATASPGQAQAHAIPLDDPRSRESADRARAELERGAHDAPSFRAALLQVPRDRRDAWVDRALGLGALPDDGPDLPRDGVPYLPCSVDVLLRAIDEARVDAGDVFVDVGAGVGRAALLAHLLTGAEAIGVEIQRHLVMAARDACARLQASGVSIVEGDAPALAEPFERGTVFFLYCPFGGERLRRVLARVEASARARIAPAVRVCCVDLPLPDCPWLAVAPRRAGDLAIYQSIL